MDAAVSTPDTGRHINGHCNTLTKVILPASPLPPPLHSPRQEEKKIGQKLIKRFFFFVFLSFQIGDPSQAADEREITPNT